MSNIWVFIYLFIKRNLYPAYENEADKNNLWKVTLNRINYTYFDTVMTSVLQEVKDVFAAVIKMLDTGDKIKVDQAHVETVIPALGELFDYVDLFNLSWMFSFTSSSTAWYFMQINFLFEKPTFNVIMSFFIASTL